jgi:hypothetical protein
MTIIIIIIIITITTTTTPNFLSLSVLSAGVSSVISCCIVFSAKTTTLKDSL